MRAPSELLFLVELRAGGQAPELPVWLTNSAMLKRNLTEAGCLVIPVVSDQWACDWSALAGLDVIVAVSFYATPVGTRLMLAVRDQSPRRFRAFVIDGRDGYFTTMTKTPPAPNEVAA